MPVSSVTEHWIKPDAVTINLNHFGDPDYLQVSVLAGAVVMAFKQDVIAYNAAHNYRTWPLQAANTYLETTSAYNVYARLSRSEVNASALIVYDPILRDIEGRPISLLEDGTEVLGEADPAYFYVFLGQISSSVGNSGQSISREWIVDFRFGNLDTNQYRNEESGGEWQKMFRLNKVTDMIDVLKTFSSAVFKRLFIGDKEIQDVQRESDGTLTPRVDDMTIPTTQFNENRFLSKKKDDRSTGTIASDKGFVVGDFNEGTLGSGASTFMRGGSSYSEVDFLKVRKKATFTNITIQELKHVGGEIILSPAAMVVSKVEEKEDGSGYICYFDSEDSDGRKIYNEFELDDLARCQTFNLSPKGADDLIGNHYYWRKVIEVGENFIVLSKNEFEYDKNSDIPQVGDNISQLGNTTNTKRQAAVIISAYGEDAPSYKQYSGVDSFSLDGKQVTKLSPYGNELTGVLNIEKGSKGWENFEGLPEEIQKAANAIETIEYGKNNLLRNSGFTGDYLTAVLDGSTSLKDTSSMFSPSLKHWEYINATAIEEKDYSESGKAVQIQDGGSISQTLYFKVIKGEKYIFSFRGKDGNVTYSIGGHSYMFELTDEWSQYVDKFTASNEGTIFTLNVTGNCTLCELQLERGTVKSAWGISPLDNRSELAKYDSLTYLQAALKGETDILGGLINTSLINMGMYDEESKMTKTTAGINGLYNEDRSIAFWAGGNSEQAVFAEATYLDNPNYIPTQEELNKMAKFVVTHGGRAILNDIILRGYIYALGGFFKGEVVAEKGSFKNINSEGDAFSIDKNGVATLLSGKIGKFRVDENFIGKRDDDKPLGFDGTMALGEDALVFNQNGKVAAFGINTLPIESGASSMALFEDKESINGLKKQALLFDIEGSDSGNLAFSGKGDGVLNGLQVGYGVRTITGTANTTKIIQDIHGGNNFIVVNDVNVGLPSYESVHKSLGIESGNFCVPVRILNMQTSEIKVQGKSSSPSSMNSDKYPEVDAVFLSNGECKTFYLVYNNGTYRACVE